MTENSQNNNENEAEKVYSHDAENPAHQSFFADAEKAKAGFEETTKGVEKEIKKLEEEIEEAKKIAESGDGGTIIDVQWAREKIEEYKPLLEIGKQKKEKIEAVIRSKMVGRIPEPIEFAPKAPPYFEITPIMPNSKEEFPEEEVVKPQGKKGEKNVPPAQDQKNIITEKVSSEKVLSKEKPEQKMKATISKSNVAKIITARGLEVGMGLSAARARAAQKESVKNGQQKIGEQDTRQGILMQAKPENAKLKEVSKGLNHEAPLQSGEQGRVKLSYSHEALGQLDERSYLTKAETLKKAKAQEKAFAALVAKENMGKTVLGQQDIKSENIKQEDIKSEQEVKSIAEPQKEKEKATELHRVRLNIKMETLRNKLERLHKKHAENIANAPTFNLNINMDDSKISKVEENIAQVDKVAQKAFLIPEYATEEFKQKASELAPQREQSDRNHILELSGRPVNDGQKPQQKSENQEENTQNKEAKQNTRTARQVDMVNYRTQQYMRGGRSTG